MGKTVPIIFVGRLPTIATGIINDMGPEIEVIHHIVEVDSATTQIPAILHGERSVPSDTGFGTHSYSRTPIAVVIGSWYDAEMITKFQAAVENPASLHWLWVDKDIPSPALGPEYSKAVALRVKSRLLALIEQCKATTIEVGMV